MSCSGTTHCIAIRSSSAATLRAGDEERLELATSMQSHKLASVSSSTAGEVGGAVSKRSAEREVVLEEEGNGEEKLTIM